MLSRGLALANIRELEEARSCASAGVPLQKSTCESGTGDAFGFSCNPDDNEITVGLIMTQCVAVYFGVTIEQMVLRHATVVEARQIAMYLCRELTDLSPKIGPRSLRSRSHTAVMREQEISARELARNTSAMCLSLASSTAREA